MAHCFGLRVGFRSGFYVIFAGFSGQCLDMFASFGTGDGSIGGPTPQNVQLRLLFLRKTEFQSNNDQFSDYFYDSVNNSLTEDIKGP